MKGFVVWGGPTRNSGGELNISFFIAAIFIAAILIIVIFIGS